MSDEPREHKYAVQLRDAVALIRATGNDDRADEILAPYYDDEYALDGLLKTLATLAKLMVDRYSKVTGHDPDDFLRVVALAAADWPDDEGET